MTFLHVAPDTWPRVECGGSLWAVAPRYVHGVSMADAERHADLHGCELPTWELVDAIWRAADCRLPPMPRDPAERDAIAKQADAIERRIEEWTADNGAPRIVAGTHKDVVRTTAGRLAIYGWHRLDGRPIQPVSSIHRLDYVDYSQGLRLVRRVYSVAA